MRRGTMIKNNDKNVNYFILTGGPGSGKTAILNELACRGYLTVPETARAIIQKQYAEGGNATHNGDRCRFRDLMLEQSITDYKKMLTEEHAVFFDRGIPDLYGYSKAFCNEISANAVQAIAQYRYNKTVFFFPPWQEIYENDEERKQDFQEALFTYKAIKEAYSYCNYQTVEVPKISIKERADFILKTVMEIRLRY